MQNILYRIPYWGFWALLVYMPFHIFLAQSVSLATGGLEVWKVGKDVALAALTLFTICLVYWQEKSSKLFNWLLGLSVLYGLLHLMLWALNPDIYQQSAILGVVYNTRVPAFLLLGLGAALLNPGKFAFSLVFKVVLAVSTVVAALGVVQYFLPSNVLTYVGYSLDRGVYPAFFIDNDESLARVMSTLRQPNALGAYLILPVAALAALLLRGVKNIGLRYMAVGSLMIHLLAILLTFSRSAWLGTVLAVTLVLWFTCHKKLLEFTKRFWPVLITLILVGVGAIWSLRDTSTFQEFVIHTTESSESEQSSTDHHILFVQESVEEIVDQPQGYGPGTAGPTSLHNPDGGQITENYFLQIAYEVGLLGLIVFFAINVLVYVHIWRRRDLFGFILIASFWGYVVTNMLLHTWANEAVAAQWWLLAGVAVAHVTTQRQKSSGKPKDIAKTQSKS